MDTIKSSVRGVVDDLTSLNVRQLLNQVVTLGDSHGVSSLKLGCNSCPSRPNVLSAAGLIVTSALMIWKSLILVTGSESPASAAAAVQVASEPLAQALPIQSHMHRRLW